VLGRLPLRYNPLNPGFRQDPHPQYRRLRERAPVHRSPLLRAWLLSRYGDVTAVLRDPHFSSDRRNSPTMAALGARLAAEVPELHRFSEGVILSKDPPDHGRLRKLVNKAFTPGVVRRLEPRAIEIMDECIDRALAKGSLELISELAFPLP